jgi:aminoglycoside phosphotransferase (APT) family kinase protein
VTAFDQRLERVLAREIAGFDALQKCDRLSGGANQETYRIEIDTALGRRLLCMRRAAGGSEEGHAPGQPGLAAEAALFDAARKAGVPEPEVHYVLREEDQIGPGFIMQWLDGEALGARIARGDAFAQVRERLAYQCGELLARIHAIDLDDSGLRKRLEVRDPREIVEQSWSRYQEYDTPQPVIDYAARWLLEHLPEPLEPCLVHGDFRNGNIMVRPDEGVVAVLDWEGAHVGDPMRDLGWLCTNSWRFGVTEKEVGGFGELSDLVAGYAAVSGEPVDPERVKFWIVYGSFNWAIGCLSMAEHYRSGPDATVERPAIGRRSSECQIDCVNLLIPGHVELPPVDGDDLDKDMPTSEELLCSVRDFLRGDVMNATEGRTRFLARVASNSLDILLREARLGAVYRVEEVRLLRVLLRSDDSFFAMKGELCRRIRGDEIDLQDDELKAYLRYSSLTQALIDQPSYSGVATAAAH